jgi:nitroreductase
VTTTTNGTTDATTTSATTSARAVLTRQEVLDLARAAHQAPSIHNTQPWLLLARPDGLDVLEDTRRALPGADPHGRERLVSCGAALYNAEVALARRGRTPAVTLLPDGDGGPRLASLRAGAPAPVTPELEALHRAIGERRTHRRIFMASGSSEHHLPALHAAVAPLQVRLAVLPAALRPAFARLTWQAAQRQVADEAVRDDLAEWTRPGRDGDGVPARSLGTAPFPVDGLLTRTRPAGEEPPAWVTDDLGQGTVAVLLTGRDGRRDWLRAGRALEALLLAATRAGLVASFIGQAVQRPDTREGLGQLLGTPGHPQVVLRIGEPLVDVPATPRRPLGEVLVDASPDVPPSVLPVVRPVPTRRD